MPIAHIICTKWLESRVQWGLEAKGQLSKPLGILEEVFKDKKFKEIFVKLLGCIDI